VLSLIFPQIALNMSKDKKFIGQPILSQILDLIPLSLITKTCKRHNSNRYYKNLTARKHLVTLMYGVFTYCNGLREMCEGMLGCEGKLNHLGLDKAPCRSTLSDANTKRSYLFFESLYFELFNKYNTFISDSRLRGLSIRNLKIIDSTTISLFTEILKGVGRNPLEGNKKKGGFKVHSMMNAFSGVVEFLRITEARVHDKKFLLHLNPHLLPNSFIVFDKAYVDYAQFDRWSAKKVWFVTRMKSNAKYHVTKVIVDNTKKKITPKGVQKEQYITLGYKSSNNEEKRLRLRRLVYIDDQGREYVFITNNFTLSNKQIAQIYKYRWMIELLFKQIKQNFPIKYFWGNSENAIKIQVFCVLIAQLLMVVARKKSETSKSFANMIAVIRLHLMSYINLMDFLKDTYKAWRKENDSSINFSP
jgi:hypothetical protein